MARSTGARKERLIILIMLANGQFSVFRFPDWGGDVLGPDEASSPKTPPATLRIASHSDPFNLACRACCREPAQIEGYAAFEIVMIREP